MRPDSHFRRNLLLVAALHVVFVGGIYFWGDLQPKKKPVQVMWLDGGSMGGGEKSEAMEAEEPAPEPPAPEPEPEPPKPEPPAPPPPEPPAPSEIVIPKSTPEPVPPKPATPKPTTPKPSTPKPTPKATPKSSPKPKASPKPKSSPASKPTGGTPAAKGENAAASGKPGTTKTSGNGEGTGNGKGPGKAGGGAGESQFGWYFEMIHDRFHNRWEQPTSIMRSAQDFVTTLKIKIAKDGTVSAREIVNSSGNTVMDESVLAAAQKVLQIDPLPAGLASGDAFEININFKLDQGR